MIFTTPLLILGLASSAFAGVYVRFYYGLQVFASDSGY